MHIPQYNLISPHNVTCMYVSRTGHLALDNQLMSLCPQLSCYLKVRALGLFNIHFGMCIGTLLV